MIKYSTLPELLGWLDFRFSAPDLQHRVNMSWQTFNCHKTSKAQWSSLKTLRSKLGEARSRRLKVQLHRVQVALPRQSAALPEASVTDPSVSHMWYRRLQLPARHHGPKCLTDSLLVTFEPGIQQCLATLADRLMVLRHAAGWHPWQKLPQRALSYKWWLSHNFLFKYGLFVQLELIQIL